MADPFTKVTEAVWEMLENEVGVTNAVPSGNRVKIYQGYLKPRIKNHYTNADLPQLELWPSGTGMNIISSTSMQITQDYVLTLKCIDQLVDVTYFPLKWELTKALASYDGNLGLSYVSNVTLDDLSESREDTDQPGYEFRLGVSVRMVFNRSDLKEPTFDV